MKKEICQAKRMEEVTLSGIRKIVARANELFILIWVNQTLIHLNT